MIKQRSLQEISHLATDFGKRFKKAQDSFVGVNPAPDKFLGNYARLIGFEVPVVCQFCSNYKPEQRLPRGVHKKYKSLRKAMLRRMRNDY